nr:MAG TPA: hypothetical protein [Caudoviricetes sp.]
MTRTRRSKRQMQSSKTLPLVWTIGARVPTA